jgi:hypothetical protein
MSGARARLESWKVMVGLRTLDGEVCRSIHDYGWCMRGRGVYGHGIVRGHHMGDYS